MGGQLQRKGAIHRRIRLKRNRRQDNFGLLSKREISHNLVRFRNRMGAKEEKVMGMF